MSTSDLLKGKVALITGCNRGIGKAIMETFAQNGADIWACARKQTNEFDGLLQELRTKHNNRITPLYFDLADESAIKEALNPLLVAKEKIDILVNNAGVAHGSFFQMTSISKIREIFEINFFSQLLVTQMVAKLMMKQKSGSIINLASIAGMDGNPGYVSYGSGKAALIYATKSIAKEFAANNVRVNAIAPGLTETAMADQMEEKAKALMISSSAMNRLAQPQEIANTALFLASDLSQFITGQVIRVDGGS
jgi:3-oxoacyl-[acyl-carrier protein] reductase